MLKLYYSPNSCALASHIALEHTGAPYEAQKIDFGRNEQRSPDYLLINPKGRVPALITERGVLTETPAILLYISQRYPQAGLAPLDDPFALAELNAFNSYLFATVHVAHAHRVRGNRWADDPAAIEAMRNKAPQVVGDCFELIERELFRGPWAMGEHYSVADPYLFTIARWLESDQIDPERFPRVADHRRRVAQLPAVAKVLEAHRPAA